jgi:flavodoxin I
MNALVVFDSMFGNTEQLARAIADVLGSRFSVCLERADQIRAIDPDGIDLLIVGGPTHRQKMSASLQAVLEATPRGALKGLKAATFDTRYRMSAWLSGSAGQRIARHLRRLGARLVVPTESFFMERDFPPEGHKRRHNLERLEAGELERATEWACHLLSVLGAS